MKIIGAAEVVGMFPPGKCSLRMACSIIRQAGGALNGREWQIDEGRFKRWVDYHYLPEPVRDTLFARGNERDWRWVYFIQAKPGPIKIGLARDIGRRLGALQTASPFPLELLARVHGGRPLEQALHEHFAASRLHGEWFDATAELLELTVTLRKQFKLR